MVNAQKRLVLLVAVFLYLTACSIQKHQRTLSFFFDDVVVPDGADQTLQGDSLTIFESQTTIAQVLKPTIIFHKPYRDKDCASCHNQDQMGSLNDSQPELCYQCHRSLITNNKSEHGPAFGGFCTECHNPHKANAENLLLQTGDDLCFRCHNITQVLESRFHYISKDSSCITCHNPHGSDNHSLLQPSACYQCHESFTKTYKIIHGPVISGHCTECHNSHRKGSDKLMIENGQLLCFHCHDSKGLLEDETHSYIENTNCTECHNPHGGEEQYMFY